MRHHLLNSKKLVPEHWVLPDAEQTNDGLEWVLITAGQFFDNEVVFVVKASGIVDAGALAISSESRNTSSGVMTLN
jgi:hypothetical protein